MSHYCEKARWALERFGLAYDEERHLQGFHYARTYWLSRNIGVPVLIDGESVIVDSTAILKHLDRYAPAAARLYPTDATQRRHVEELEDLFDEILGVESRRWLYFHYLTYPKAALQIAGQGAPAIERALAFLVFPLLRRFAAWRMQVSSSTIAAGLERSRKIVRQTDAMLADGRSFLTQWGFSAADLSLACMLAPYVVPEEYGIRLPPIEQLPPGMQPTVHEFRNTTTGQYVLRLFRSYRHRRVDHESVVS
jgi:glutathione S-transferase